jgi:hypothetical protein
MNSVCACYFIDLGNVYRAFVFLPLFAERSQPCLNTLFHCNQVHFNGLQTQCASFNRLSLLRCHISHSRRQRDSSTSAFILRLDLAILACHFSSHFHSLVRVLKKEQDFRSFLPVSSLSVYFQFAHLLPQVPCCLLRDRASECARFSPKLEQSNKQILVGSFSSNFPTFPLLLQ